MAKMEMDYHMKNLKTRKEIRVTVDGNHSYVVEQHLANDKEHIRQ